MDVVNFHNPCQKLDMGILNELLKNVTREKHTIILGDFTAHNTLWGSHKTDANGEVVEELVNDRNLVTLNNEDATRVDYHTWHFSCLDLSFAPPSIASKTTWQVLNNSFGSDHYPILCQLNILKVRAKKVEQGSFQQDSQHILSTRNVNWDNFRYLMDKQWASIEKEDNALQYEAFVERITIILNSMGGHKGTKMRKHNSVSWWNKECSCRIKERNGARNKLKCCILRPLI